MPEIPEEILRYVATRDAQRDDAVTRALGALSDRERRLVREAAVMGYVQGTRYADTPIPKDSVVVWRVIDACRAFDELYPTISALGG